MTIGVLWRERGTLKSLRKKLLTNLRTITKDNIDLLVALLTLHEYNDWVQTEYGEKIKGYFIRWQKDDNEGEKFYEVAKIGAVSLKENLQYSSQLQTQYLLYHQERRKICFVVLTNWNFP